METLNPNSRRAQSALYGDNELRAHLTDRLASGAWWLFVAASPLVTAGCLLEIEKRFYSNSGADDFELAIVPWRLGRPMTAIACARKRRLPARKLLRTLARFMKPEALEVARGGLAAGRDLLVLDDDGPTNGRALMMAVLELFQRGAALQAAMRN
jgi:hypothetical protein